MPHLTIVIGGNGAGKTTWANTHRNVLPSRFYNADSIAVGLGDWNDEERQREAREIVDRQIERRLKALDDFGFESTYSGRSRPAIVERARACNYKITAVFIGTESPEINVQRVVERTKNGTGHAVKPSEIRRRWEASQDNLTKTIHAIDTLDVIDNSGANATKILTIRNRRVVHEYTPAPRWVSNLAKRLNAPRNESRSGSGRPVAHSLRRVQPGRPDGR